MSATLHEEQNREIRNIELRLERMEAIATERNRKSDEITIALTRLDAKFDAFIAALPKEYVSMREFFAYQESMKSILAERKDGTKTWQSWVMLLAPTAMSAIMTLYVLFGSR